MKISGVLSLLIAVVVIPVAALADVVELVTGEHVEGKGAQVTADSVQIEVGGQSLKFPRGRVRAIYLGSAVPSTKAENPASSTGGLRLLVTTLRDLAIAANTTTPYEEFSRRLIETKLVFERTKIESLPPAGLDLYKRILNLKGFYVLTTTSWDSLRRRRFISMAPPSELWDECSPQAKQTADESLRIGYAGGIDLAFACASSSLATIEGDLKRLEEAKP